MKSSIKDDYDKKFIYAGDAYYILDPDLNILSPEQKFRLGIICLSLQFNSTGINLIRQSNLINDQIINEIEFLATRPVLVRKLAILWKTPALISNFFKLKNVS